MLVHHAAAVGCVVACLFVLQSSLVPYDFAPPDAAKPWLVRSAAGSGSGDIVSNIFLYIPLGYLLTWWLRGKVLNGTTAMLLTLVLSGAMSLGIEAVQHWLPSRVSSLVDVISNLIGAGAGATISFFTHALLPKLLGAALDEIQITPMVAATKAYFLLLVICATAPFTFAIDAGKFREAAKNAVIVPFGSAPLSDWIRDDGLGAGFPERPEIVEWRTLRRYSRWMAEAASFCVLGWLLIRILRRHYRFERLAAIQMAIWIGGLLAVVLSGLQFLVVSRGFDAGDIASRWIGLAGGVAWGVARRTVTETFEPGGGRWVWLLAAGLTAAFISYCGLIPVRFTAGTEALGRLFEPAAVVPFLGYFESRYDRVLEDVVEKILAFAVLAALLCRCHAAAGWGMLRPTIACVALSAMIELMQAFNPVRVPSVTDLLLAAAGGWLGVWAYSHVQAIVEFSRQLAPQAVGEARIPAAPSLEDALLSQLSEPHPQAPLESPPRRASRRKARSRGRRR